ncbi:Hypothetical protein SRAE_2000283800 [Strongyloides ratti]|uniref:Uncharacterized protein n=1 Tax=Strongyloides ratti TaxID=34506 RepID=A0A090LKY0_STRRB|nr:Hypothetical protein SRAE_2000283800 [Strongyloides ratti]CEF68180.1 Hypothetical protein SRAE_2000283800 [Strongyloides ratti]
MSVNSSTLSTSLSSGQSINKNETEKRKKKVDLFLGKTIQDMIDLINDSGFINECDIKLKKIDSKKVITFKISVSSGKLHKCEKYPCDCQGNSTRYVTSDGTSLLSSSSNSISSSQSESNSRSRLTNTSISDCKCGCANGKNVTSYTSTDTSDFNSDIFSATTESSGGSSLCSSTTNSYICNSGKVGK